jgi:hypothetical protein
LLQLLCRLLPLLRRPLPDGVSILPVTSDFGDRLVDITLVVGTLWRPLAAYMKKTLLPLLNCGLLFCIPKFPKKVVEPNLVRGRSPELFWRH